MNPWKILGLKSGSSSSDIRAAYRKLLRTYHPDTGKSKEVSVERLQEVKEAYESLIKIPANIEQKITIMIIPFYKAFEGGSVQEEKIFESPCLSCRGFGCKKCKGGINKERKTLIVSVPPGADSGLIIDAKTTKGETLSVQLEVEPSIDYQRQLNSIDLIFELPLSPAEAALGLTTKLPTPTKFVQLKIPPGTQPGKIFKLQGQGMPKLDQPQERGDLIIKVRIDIPTDLTTAQKRAYEELLRIENKN